MNVEIGKKYKNWLVLSEASEQGNHKYLCRCICGEQRFVTKYNLGVVLGCGCVRKEYESTGKYSGTKKPKAKILKVIAGKSSTIKPPEPLPKSHMSTDVDKRNMNARAKIELIKEQRELEKYYGEIL